MNQLATYNLGTVLRETGINADTLRAWERRYNLPQPERTEGGHRLYSEHDVEVIKWLMRQQTRGMRIGQAVKLWQSRVVAGEDPLSEGTQPVLISADHSQLESFRSNWIAACIAFNDVRAEQVASQVFSRFSPEVAFTEIFVPAIREIGELWYQGKVSVQQEHFASALLMRRLNALITSAPVPTRPEKIIVACPPKEEHTLSSLMLTLFLRRRGYHVVYLGTNVPLEEFRETVDSIQPQLVLFSAQQLSSAATLEQTVRELAPCGVTIGYSGRIFHSTPATQERVHGHFLGMGFPEILASIETLLAHKAEEYLFPENPHQALLDAFHRNRAGIHALLNETLAQWDFPLQALTVATEALSENIAAALYLGNLDLLLPELAWVKDLLNHRDIKIIQVENFLDVYAKASYEILGEISAPLVEWLETQSEIYANA